MTMTQRDYKNMKKDVDEFGAYGVGFFEGIESQIPLYVWVDVVRDIASQGWVTATTTDVQMKQMLITESIKRMNFQDFKAVAPYLFSYPREQREADLLVRPIEISRDYFEELKAKAHELFNLKRDLSNLETKQSSSLEEVIDHITNRTVVEETGFELLGISQDQSQFLVVDKRPADQRPSFLGDFYLEDERLVNDYRKGLSDKAQILKALLEASDEVKDYLYTFYNDNYREATGYLEGLEDLANYFVSDGLDPALLDQVDNTSLMWEKAQLSPTFRQDYEFLTDFLEEYNLWEYMLDNADQIIDYPDHLAYINQLLAKENKAVLVKDIRGYNQGDFWTLGALYDTTDNTMADMDFFLEHEAGAYYKGALIEAFIIDKADLEQVGLEGAVSLADSLVFDQELLLGIEVDELAVFSRLFDRKDMISLDEAMAETVQNQEKVVHDGLER